MVQARTYAPTPAKAEGDHVPPAGDAHAAHQSFVNDYLNTASTGTGALKTAQADKSGTQPQPMELRLENGEIVGNPAKNGSAKAWNGENSTGKAASAETAESPAAKIESGSKQLAQAAPGADAPPQRAIAPNTDSLAAPGADSTPTGPANPTAPGADTTPGSPAASKPDTPAQTPEARPTAMDLFREGLSDEWQNHKGRLALEAAVSLPIGAAIAAAGTTVSAIAAIGGLGYLAYKGYTGYADAQVVNHPDGHSAKDVADAQQRLRDDGATALDVGAGALGGGVGSLFGGSVRSAAVSGLTRLGVGADSGAATGAAAGAAEGAMTPHPTPKVPTGDAPTPPTPNAQPTPEVAPKPASPPPTNPDVSAPKPQQGNGQPQRGDAATTPPPSDDLGGKPRDQLTKELFGEKPPKTGRGVEEYAEESGQRMSQFLMSNHLLDKDVKVLDIGAGHNQPFAWELQKYNPSAKVTSLDPTPNDPDAMQVPNLRTPRQPHPDLVVANAAKMPPEWSNSYDKVFAMYSVPTYSKPAEIPTELSEMVRVLKPGGTGTILPLPAEDYTVATQALQKLGVPYTVSETPRGLYKLDFTKPEDAN